MGRGRPRAGQRPVLDQPGARRAAFELLAQKSWSGLELTRRLRRRGAPDDVARDVVRDLEARGYVDDESFARWWAEARARGRRVGSVRLRQELLAKGIPRELVAAAVASAFESTSEVDRALEAGRRRLTALGRAERDRLPSRLGQYLLRRGYPGPVVSRVVRQLLAGRGGEELPEPVDDASV